MKIPSSIGRADSLLAGIGNCGAEAFGADAEPGGIRIAEVAGAAFVTAHIRLPAVRHPKVGNVVFAGKSGAS